MTARLPDERPTGPRRSPYDHELSRWRRISADDELWLQGAIPGPSAFSGIAFEETTPTPARVAYAAYRIISQHGVPLLRRFIEANLIHVGGFDPVDVQAALVDLRVYVPNAVVQVGFPVPGELDSHLYGTRAPTSEERDHLLNLIMLDRSIFGSDVLGSAAEQFVRLCFKKAKRYRNVTRKMDLGDLPPRDE